MDRNKVICVDYKEGMAQLDDDSIDMIMTSPPYWQARDYGFHSDLGFENSPKEYVNNLTPFLEESLRVLKPTGGLWLNVGDARSQGKRRQRGRRDTTSATKGEKFKGWDGWDGDLAFVDVDVDVPPKSFIGIPEMVMLRTLDIGFTVRNKIVWAKGMMKYTGESYGGTTPAPHLDNFLVVWEPVYYLTKTKHNYFNMDAAQIPANSHDGMKSPLNVWVVPPSAGREKFTHKGKKNFATYPPALVDIAIRAGCPPTVCLTDGKPLPMMPDYKTFKGCEHVHLDTSVGMILDPFCGSGTTAVSAVRNGFDYLMFDISPEQCEFAEARIEYNDRRNKENQRRMAKREAIPRGVRR